MSSENRKRRRGFAIPSRSICALARLDGFFTVEPHAPAKKILRMDGAEDDVGVGPRCRRAALAVARGPGVGARRLRADAQRPGVLVDACERAAARADRLDVDPG